MDFDTFSCQLARLLISKMAAYNIFTFAFALLVLTSCFHLTDENIVLHVQCTPQPYAQEGITWTCRCVFSGVSGVERVYWPGHSDNSTLVVPSVTRQQNGTNYTCQVEYVEDNLLKTANTVHYLKVAYGPDNGSVRIYGIDGPFRTDGTRNLTLTCNATDTYPKPSIYWLSEPCKGKEETCVFQPQPKYDGSIMKCRAINAHTQPLEKSSYAEGALNLTYPPTNLPLLTGHKDYQIHKSGDTLTCTVTGGKPLVAQVIFNCSNPTLYDQADVVSGTSVSSSLTIDSSQQTYTETTCQCSAIWEPDPTLYTKSVSASFAIIAQANEGDKWKNVAIAILVYALAITVILFLLGLWIIKPDLFPRAITQALVKRLPKSDRLGTGSHTVPDIEVPQENGSAGEMQPLLNASGEQNPPPDSLNTTTAQNLDTATAQNVDTVTAQNLHAHTAQNVDTVTAQNLNAATAQSIDTTTAQNVDTVTAHNFDTSNAQNVDTTTAQNVDTVTTQNLNTTITQNLDTTTAQNIDAATAQSGDTVYCEPLDLEDLRISINLSLEDNADLQTGLSELPERDEVYHVSREKCSSGHLESEGNPGSKNLLQALSVGGPSSDQNTRRPAATPRGSVRDRSSPTASLV